MKSEKTFQIALIISVTTHVIFFFNNPHFYIPSSPERQEKLEVSYIKEKEKKAPEKYPTTDIISKNERFLNLPAKITADKRIPPPFIDRQKSLKNMDRDGAKDPFITKPALLRPDVIAVKKRITLPPIDMGNINNPSYISYYQVVREKIRRCAYNNYVGTETGQVCLLFTISAEGNLTQVKIAEGKSAPSMNLKQTALASVRDAAPFPKFPKELDYPQLSFRLEIAFNIE